MAPAAKKAASKAKPAVAKAKKPAKKAPATKKKEAAATSAADTEAAAATAADVVIEASKECNAFKTRAEAVQKLIKASKPDAIVVINPERVSMAVLDVCQRAPELMIVALVVCTSLAF